MSKKTTIRIEGDEQTTIAALMTWALLRLQIRPAYEGDNWQAWQKLASDELELEIKMRELLNAPGGITFTVSEKADPRVGELTDKLNTAVRSLSAVAPLKTPEELKQEIPAAAEIIDSMAKKSE